MKRKIISVVLTISIFLIAALPAVADLTSNLITDSDFQNPPGTPQPIFTGANSGDTLSTGVWYTSKSGSSATNDWQISSLAALLWSSGGGGRTGTLIQSVYVPMASYGPVEFKFAYSKPDDNGIAQLYGSNSQPSYGSYGTQIGTTVNLTDSSGWQNVNEIFGGASFSGYDWYTVLFYGDMSDKNKLYIDAVSLKVSQGTVDPVPTPAAIWLFGPGLLGLIGLRKRIKKA